MTTSLPPPPQIVTIADLLRRLGELPADRVRFYPIPGTATVGDVVEVERREKRLCELVDGVLVEKPAGLPESVLAVELASRLRDFVKPRKLGIVTGEGGMVRLFGDLVRIPDVAFVSWDRLPGRRVPTDPVPQLAPDLAAEILSPSNTPAEMARKRAEYFTAGVRLVWSIDPGRRTVSVYTGPEAPAVLTESDTLDGGTVLPGFQLPLRDLFAELDQVGDPTPLSPAP